MNDALMNTAKTAVNARSTALAAKVLRAVNEGSSQEHIANQIAQHIITVEWPAAAMLFVDIEAGAK